MIDIFKCPENTPEFKEQEHLIKIISEFEDKTPTFAF
jgi:hypothetical protein